MRSIKILQVGLLFLTLQLLLSQSLSGANPVEFPKGVHYHRFAALVDGPEAVWINPAALGAYQSVSAQITGDFYDGSFAQNWGFCTAGDGVGLSYRHLDNIDGEDYKEYLAGAGLRTGYGIFVGGSYRHVKDGPEYLDDTHFWNIGLLVRQNPNLYMAAVISNLNREEVGGIKTDIGQLYSASCMPFGRHLRISTEISLSTKQSLSGATYVYGAEFYPIPGLTGYFNFDNDENYELGVRVNLTQYFVGVQSSRGSGGVHYGTSLTAGIVSGPQASIIKPKPRKIK